MNEVVIIKELEQVHVCIKGLTRIFLVRKNGTHESFSEARKNIWIKINGKIPVKLMKLWRKGYVWFLSFIVVHYTVFLISYIFVFICYAFKRKEYDFWKQSNIMNMIRHLKMVKWSLNVRIYLIYYRSTLLNCLTHFWFMHIIFF